MLNKFTTILTGFFTCKMSENSTSHLLNKQSGALFSDGLPPALNCRSAAFLLLIEVMKKGRDVCVCVDGIPSGMFKNHWMKKSPWRYPKALLSKCFHLLSVCATLRVMCFRLGLEISSDPSRLKDPVLHHPQQPAGQVAMDPFLFPEKSAANRLLRCSAPKWSKWWCLFVIDNPCLCAVGVQITSWLRYCGAHYRLIS